MPPSEHPSHEKQAHSSQSSATDDPNNEKSKPIAAAASPEDDSQPPLSKKERKKKAKQEAKDKKSLVPKYKDLSYEGLDEREAEILKEQVQVPETKLSYLTLFRYATAWDRFLVAIALISSVVSGAALPLFTLIFGNITQVFTNFLVYHTNPDEFQHTVNHNTLYFVYLGIGITAVSFLQTFLHVDRGEVIAARIREQYLKAVLRQNIGYFDRVGAGEVTTRITSDINQIQDGISEKVGLLVSGFATFIAGFVIGFIKSWRMTLILSCAVVAILLDMGISSKFIVQYTTANLAAVGEASSVAEDVLSSIRNTVAFSSQRRLADKFDAKLDVALKAGISRGKALAIMVAGLWAIIYLTYGLAFWQGSRFIVDGVQTAGSLVTVVMAIIIGAFSLGGVAPSVQAIGGAMGAAHKIYEAIDRKPYIDASDDKAGETPADFEGHISFKDVKFVYPSRPNVPILEDFSLDIEPGQTVALVGSSGSGKSTIIGLLERFYAALGGSITVDGRPIESLNIKWLRRQMALVSQEPTLFSCSIYENIEYGLIGTEYEHAEPSVKMDLIMNACREANAWDFIQTLTNGLDTEVGERGFLLSGGQKQRIAIARAIVSQPKLLLLDEATSALDTKSEGIVQEALDRALKSRTTIVIAHRLSTIKDADKIVVMSKGQIVEIGTHDELLKKQGAYYLLVQAQNIRTENEEQEAQEEVEEYTNEEGQLEQKLTRNQTRNSEYSVSAKVIEDLENQGHYEQTVKTRSTWTLIRFVSIFSFFFLFCIVHLLTYLACFYFQGRQPFNLHWWFLCFGVWCRLPHAFLPLR